MTYKEVVYIINDILKVVVSDDSYYEKDHILFLANKFRGYIAKKYYDSIKKKIPQSYYQEICLTMETYSNGDFCDGNGNLLRSTSAVPNTMSVANTSVYPEARLVKPFVIVTPERFPYCNGTKYYKPIYATVDYDKKLYVKSSMPLYFNSVRMVGVFEDIMAAEELACCQSDSCDIMDRKFPMEDNFMPELLELVVKELTVGSYKPIDNVNNATDDLSDIARFVRTYMKDYYTKNHLNGTPQLGNTTE